MSRRTARVSEAQWSILLDFLERHPNLARARNYNNSARGRAETLRLWEEVAALLNAEGSGTTKNAKDWSTYVSNYKSKLKKLIADINAEATGTGGGPPRCGSLSETENRFLAVMGEGFGQTTPHVSVDPFPSEEQQQPSPVAAMPQILDDMDSITLLNDIQIEEVPSTNRAEQPVSEAETPPSQGVADAAAPPLPSQTRRTRYRSRPLAPLDEARRILSQVEMQRAEADAAKARGLQNIGGKLGQIANASDRIGVNLGRLADAANLIGENLGRIADAAEKFLSSTP